MKNFEVIVDLVKLKTPYCGLGQVAMNYGIELSRSTYPGIKMTLLTPSRFVGYFGKNVSYRTAGLISRHLSYFTDRCDLWHATHQDSPFMPSRRSTPYLLTIHDLNFLYEKSEAKAAKYLKRLQEKVNRATVVTAISEFTASEIRNHIDLKGKEVRVVYNGVQFENEPEMRQPSWIGQDSRPFFLSLGLVTAKKNIHVLPDMMKLIPEYDLYICGQCTGEYGAELQKRVEEENLTHVKMVGAITEHEKNWMYQHCTAFVFPSKHEGFGLPVIEAMHRGKPVFSSELSSLKEIGDKYAYFWKNFDPEQMAKVVRNGLDHFSKHPEVAQTEMEYARSFSYQRNVAEYLSIYKEILGII